jgi:beta-lactamase regulating signal transducer with metallopeptidase domain
MLDVFANRAWQHLVIALLHTLWQGALLALLMSFALRKIPARHHDARYGLALAAQFGLLLAGLITWSVLDHGSRGPQAASTRAETVAVPLPAGPDAPTPVAVPSATSRPRTASPVPRWVPIVAIGWLIGLGLMLARMAGSVLSAARLARGSRIIDTAILAMVDRLRGELRVCRSIRVVAAGAAQGPAVLGVIWPTLLLPVAALAGLPPDSLQAILIHELAHIRRHDYLVNLAQMLVEALLFFNPAIWWIGRQVRIEREACCDALAVRLTGRPLDYSRWLADWAGLWQAPAVGPAWSGGHRSSALLERVRRVLDPENRPAAQVSVSGLVLLFGGPLLLLGFWRGTDAAVGLAAEILAAAGRLEGRRTAAVPGDQPHARRARGLAVDRAGKPVARATVRVFFEEASTGRRTHQLNGPILTTTDEQGRFTLDTLENDVVYALLVQSPEGGYGIGRSVRPGRDDIRITVGPKLTIQGTVGAAPGTRGQDPTPRFVGVVQVVRLHDEGLRSETLRSLSPVDDQGRVTIADLLPCDTWLYVGGWILSGNLERSDMPLTIDLTRPMPALPRRQAVLRLVAPDGGGVASGEVDYLSFDPIPDPNPSDPFAGGWRWVYHGLKLDKGQVVFDAPVPARMHYQVRSMTGYWCKDGDVEITPGAGAQIVEIPVAPTGAIVGQVLEADGKPAVGVGQPFERDIILECRTVEELPGVAVGSSPVNNVRPDAQGRFVMSPPLGGTYQVVARRGYSLQVSPPVRPDRTKPPVRVEIRLSRGVAGEGRVVGPDGQPLAGVLVGLQIVNPFPGTGSMGWSPEATDRDGRFRFDGLSAGTYDYRVGVNPRKEYQPAEARLRPGGPPVEIQLRRGHVVEGRILDAATDRAIPGISLLAIRLDQQPGESVVFEAESKTDELGRFRFSTLSQGWFRLHDRSGLKWDVPQVFETYADHAKPIEIRATMPGGNTQNSNRPRGR